MIHKSHIHSTIVSNNQAQAARYAQNVSIPQKRYVFHALFKINFPGGHYFGAMVKVLGAMRENTGLRLASNNFVQTRPKVV